MLKFIHKIILRIKAANTAKVLFKLEYPSEDIQWTRVIEEETRYVVIVRHGHSRPLGYEFYAVQKLTYIASQLEDRKFYLPHGDL